MRRNYIADNNMRFVIVMVIIIVYSYLTVIGSLKCQEKYRGVFKIKEFDFQNKVDFRTEMAF